MIRRALVGALAATLALAPAAKLPDVAKVVAWVTGAQTTKTLPSNLLGQLSGESNATFLADLCLTKPGSTSAAKACAFGDTSSRQTVVLYGDSFALQWTPALAALGTADHFKVLVYARLGCPFANIAIESYTGSVDKGCAPFRSNALKAIRALSPKPLLVVLAEEFDRTAPGGKWGSISIGAYASAMSATLSKLPHLTVAVLQGVPAASSDPSTCLAAHPADVTACSDAPAVAYNLPADKAFAATVKSARDSTVNVSMLLCGARCPDVIDGMLVHSDEWHFDKTYVAALAPALGSLLGCVSRAGNLSRLPAGTKSSCAASEALSLGR